MKNRLLTGLLATALLGFTACTSDDPMTLGSATGRISLDLDINSSVVTATGSRGLEYSDVTKDHLTLHLASADGSYDKSWAYGEFPADEKFKVGDYTLEAFYGDADEEGFENPYFYGKQNIKVTENNTTSVAMTVAMGKAMVSIDYTDAFKNYFTAFNAELLTPAGRTVAFLSDETRAAYVTPGETALFVTVTKPNGQTATLQPATIDTEARHHYRITLDTKQGAGDATLAITFDEMLAQEDVEIELSDELMNAPAPVITVKGLEADIDGTYRLATVAGEEYKGDLKLNLVARGYLAAVPMTTTSDALTSRGWPASLDLMAATAGQQSVLSQLGLSAIGLWNNPERMAVIDLAGVPANIAYKEGGNNDNTLVFFVRDRFAKVCEPVTVVISVEKLVLALSNPSIIQGTPDLKVDLAYNGSDIDNVKLQLKNSRGTWDNVSYTYTVANAAPSRAGVQTRTYHLTVPVTAGQAKYELRALCGSTTTETVTATPEAGTIVAQAAAANEDVFATSAKLSFTTTEGSAADFVAAASVAVIDSKGKNVIWDNITRSGNTITINGLTPGATYQAYAFETAHGARQSSTVSFTTEADTQLPNANMDSWYTVNGDTSYWWVEYPGTSTDTPWGTMNQLTTSAGGSTTSVFIVGTRDGCSWNAFSGTRGTTDAVSGKAAVIETVAWGKTNNASITQSGKTATAGQLYLGSYNASTKAPDYGYAFSSRPASMSFSYKYTAKNPADYGYAEITVTGADDEVLATASVNLEAQATYKTVTLPLSYSVARKAQGLKVIFKSTNNPDCLARTADNFTSPSSNSDTSGRHTGSSLYIDNITLNY